MADPGNASLYESLREQIEQGDLTPAEVDAAVEARQAGLRRLKRLQATHATGGGGGGGWVVEELGYDEPSEPEWEVVGDEDAPSAGLAVIANPSPTRGPKKNPHKVKFAEKMATWWSSAFSRPAGAKQQAGGPASPVRSRALSAASSGAAADGEPVGVWRDHTTRFDSLRAPTAKDARNSRGRLLNRLDRLIVLYADTPTTKLVLSRATLEQTVVPWVPWAMLDAECEICGNPSAENCRLCGGAFCGAASCIRYVPVAELGLRPPPTDAGLYGSGVASSIAAALNPVGPVAVCVGQCWDVAVLPPEPPDPASACQQLFELHSQIAVRHGRLRAAREKGRPVDNEELEQVYQLGNKAAGLRFYGRAANAVRDSIQQITVEIVKSYTRNADAQSEC